MLFFHYTRIHYTVLQCAVSMCNVNTVYCTVSKFEKNRGDLDMWLERHR